MRRNACEKKRSSDDVNRGQCEKWRQCKGNMALVRDMIFKARPKITKLLKIERESLSLKAVNKLTVRFDPFREDVGEIREFNHLIHIRELQQTNPKCLIKTEILTDRSEQSITFELTNGKTVIFKCGKLSCLEIFKLMNEHLTPLAPKEDLTLSPVKEIKKKKSKK